MSASLVGSEMCIRDRMRRTARHRAAERASSSTPQTLPRSPWPTPCPCTCLLYTSDAADDM
eukprot:1982370-Alexandrium_andersonii.AAC.1